MSFSVCPSIQLMCARSQWTSPTPPHPSVTHPRRPQISTTPYSDARHRLLLVLHPVQRRRPLHAAAAAAASTTTNARATANAGRAAAAAARAARATRAARVPRRPRCPRRPVFTPLLKTGRRTACLHPSIVFYKHGAAVAVWGCCLDECSHFREKEQ